MGLAFTKLFARLFSKKEMRILMVREGRREGERGSRAQTRKSGPLVAPPPAAAPPADPPPPPPPRDAAR